MKMLNVMLLLLSFALIGPLGCGLANSTFRDYDFTRDADKTTTVGSPMITWTEPYSRNDVYGHLVTDKMEHTLIYAGREGSILRVSYKEMVTPVQTGFAFAGTFARPAFTQELTYDISTSPDISFQDFRIQVLEATSSTIRFRVRESACFAAPSGRLGGGSDNNVRARK